MRNYRSDPYPAVLGTAALVLLLGCLLIVLP